MKTYREIRERVEGLQPRDGYVFEALVMVRCLALAKYQVSSPGHKFECITHEETSKLIRLLLAQEEELTRWYGPQMGGGGIG